MDDTTNQPTIEDLVHDYQHKNLSRGRFVAALMGLGATAIATLLASAEADAATLPPRRVLAPTASLGQENNALHNAHVQRQSRATQQGMAAQGSLSEVQLQHLQAMVEDYVDDAVVEDPLFAAPIVGKPAIRERKLAEMRSMAGAMIEVVNRVARGNQVVAEWVVRGTHQGDFLGFKATGRTIEVRGVTVVTRKNGKIVRESLYYDVADLHRQLG